jgi:hypothetical protein
MAPSAIDKKASANSRALSSMSSPCEPTRSLRHALQMAKKLPFQKLAISVCSAVRALSEKEPRAFTSL